VNSAQGLERPYRATSFPGAFACTAMFLPTEFPQYSNTSVHQHFKYTTVTGSDLLHWLIWDWRLSNKGSRKWKCMYKKNYCMIQWHTVWCVWVLVVVSELINRRKTMIDMIVNLYSCFKYYYWELATVEVLLLSYLRVTAELTELRTEKERRIESKSSGLPIFWKLPNELLWSTLMLPVRRVAFFDQCTQCLKIFPM